MIDFFKSYINKLSYYSKVILALIVLLPLLTVIFGPGMKALGYYVYPYALLMALLSFIIWLFILVAIKFINII